MMNLKQLIVSVSNFILNFYGNDRYTAIQFSLGHPRKLDDERKIYKHSRQLIEKGEP